MEKRDYLIGFSVEGFRGFTDKCVWDLKRHHKYAFGSEFVYGDVIYRPIVFGPCAAGKTDLGLALMDIVCTMGNATPAPEYGRDRSYINMYTEDGLAKFSYSFLIGGHTVRYSYSKRSFRQMCYEALAVDDAPIFVIVDGVPTKMRDHPGTRIRVPECDTVDGPFLKRLLADDSDTDILSRLRRFISGMLYADSYGLPHPFIGMMQLISPAEEYVIQRGKVKQFAEFVYSMLGMRIELGVVNGELCFLSGPSSVPFADAASSGLRFLLDAFSRLDQCMKDASLVYLDNFDSFLYESCRGDAVRSLVTGSNCQLIVSATRSGIFDVMDTRPDCCFRISDHHIDALPSVTDCTFQKKSSLSKMMRDGKFNRSAGTWMISLVCARFFPLL